MEPSKNYLFCCAVVLLFAFVPPRADKRRALTLRSEALPRNRKTAHQAYYGPLDSLRQMRRVRLNISRGRGFRLQAWTGSCRFSLGSALMDFPAFSWARRRS